MSVTTVRRMTLGHKPKSLYDSLYVSLSLSPLSLCLSVSLFLSLFLSLSLSYKLTIQKSTMSAMRVEFLVYTSSYNTKCLRNTVISVHE